MLAASERRQESDTTALGRTGAGSPDRTASRTVASTRALATGSPIGSEGIAHTSASTVSDRFHRAPTGRASATADDGLRTAPHLRCNAVATPPALPSAGVYLHDDVEGRTHGQVRGPGRARQRGAVQVPLRQLHRRRL